MHFIMMWMNSCLYWKTPAFVCVLHWICIDAFMTFKSLSRYLSVMTKAISIKCYNRCEHHSRAFPEVMLSIHPFLCFCWWLDTCYFHFVASVRMSSKPLLKGTLFTQKVLTNIETCDNHFEMMCIGKTVSTVFISGNFNIVSWDVDMIFLSNKVVKIYKIY